MSVTQEEIAGALTLIGQAMSEDPTYAWEWHKRLSMMTFETSPITSHLQIQRHVAGYITETFGFNITATEQWPIKMQQWENATPFNDQVKAIAVECGLSLEAQPDNNDDLDPRLYEFARKLTGKR